MQNIKHMLLVMVLVITLPGEVLSQWNYDNQNLIYSRNGNVGIGLNTPGKQSSHSWKF